MIELVVGVVELFYRQRIFLGVKTNCDDCHGVVFARTWEVGDEKTAEDNVEEAQEKRRGEKRKSKFEKRKLRQDVAVVR
jgi:hypothetical protein